MSCYRGYIEIFDPVQFISIAKWDDQAVTIDCFDYS